MGDGSPMWMENKAYWDGTKRCKYTNFAPKQGPDGKDYVANIFECHNPYIDGGDPKIFEYFFTPGQSGYQAAYDSNGKTFGGMVGRKRRNLQHTVSSLIDNI